MARTLRDLDARNLDLKAMAFRSKAAETSCGLRSARWPNARIFLCERRAKIPEILQFFHANLPRHLRDLDDGRTLFWLCTQCRLGDQLQRCRSV